MDQCTRKFINALTNPDKKYGEVPFYWWSGDKLDKDRLTSQLEKLAAKGVAGVQINYAHLNKGGEFNEQYGGHGKTIPGDPVQFSEAWWEMFTHAAKVCERLGMGIGVGDYTLAWIGNGFFTDTIAADENMNARNMSCEKKMLYAGDEEKLSDDVLAAVTYPTAECDTPEVIYEKGKGVLSPVKGCCEAYIITIKRTPFSIDPLAEGCGRKLVEIYFEEFERRIPALKKGTLNYFFQDELMFGCDEKTIWRENLREGILEKYGYDVLGFLPHLFFDLGNITAKIRLDVSDVRTALSEDNYFKPIYRFHSTRGMIYGCDQSGRGKQPDEFSDYFRTVRWFTAPGNDTPGRAADLIKVKVNSSIAHLYNRPRVWLEGYHSSGWGTTLESITAPTSDNFIFGANLLNLHGLYYSTYGGFFEWAPPDFHFRMPYWDDEEQWLLKYKRLAALLTTGSHRCDAAIYYPVSSCEYGINSEACVSSTFSTAEFIFNAGIDFDFIDFQSIERARCSEGKLKTSDEEYRVLIFAGVDCIRYSAIRKIKEFLDNGGTVAFYGITPYASDRAGANDSVLNNDILDILSHPNCRLTVNEDDLLSFINSRITRSFLPEEAYWKQKTYVCQRVLGNTKLFFVRYAPRDSVCRFEAMGTPFLLDTYKGTISRLDGTIALDGFTFIKMPNEANEDTVILFTDDLNEYDNVINTSGFEKDTVVSTVPLNTDWDMKLIPTLDNTYGDFYLPAGGIIGAQARFFKTEALKNGEVINAFDEMPYCTDSTIKRIYTPGRTSKAAEYAANIPELTNGEKLCFGGEEYAINVLPLHARYGYINLTRDNDISLFEQGFHGLKCRVYDDNMYFDDDCIFVTDVKADADCNAFLHICGIAPDVLYLNGKEITDTAAEVELTKGRNRLVAGFIYDGSKCPEYRMNCKMKRSGIYFVKKKDFSATDIPLTKTDFANDDFLRTGNTDTDTDTFRFTFTAPPDMRAFSVNVFGEVTEAFHNGEKMMLSRSGNGNFGGNIYSAVTCVPEEKFSEVSFTVRSDRGYEYTALIPEPIDIICGENGKADCGDLSKTGALKCYSGKIVYHKTVYLEKINMDERFILDLGDVGATAKVVINGKTAAIFTFAPFRTDITDYVTNGTNDIEITVSTTLSNHYSTIPSLYSNFPQDAKSGLIGPAEIKVIKE